MSATYTRQEAESFATAAAQKAVEADRSRLYSIVSRLGFTREAYRAFTAGLSPQEAVDRADRMRLERGEAAAPTTPAPRPAAATPPPPRDFVAEARRKAAAEGIPITEAMRALAKSDPELHRSWLARQRQGR